MLVPQGGSWYDLVSGLHGNENELGTEVVLYIYNGRVRVNGPVRCWVNPYLSR